jgi:hypothetical protein
MQPPQPDRPSAVLPSNVLDNRSPPEPELGRAKPHSGALADMVVAAQVLAMVVTGLVEIGPRLGGPVPTLRFWSTLGPLLVLPLAILLGLALAPGGILPDRVAGWRPRTVLGLGGLSTFVAALLILNLPVLLSRPV